MPSAYRRGTGPRFGRVQTGCEGRIRGRRTGAGGGERASEEQRPENDPEERPRGTTPEKDEERTRREHCAFESSACAAPRTRLACRISAMIRAHAGGRGRGTSEGTHEGGTTGAIGEAVTRWREPRSPLEPQAPSARLVGPGRARRSGEPGFAAGTAARSAACATACAAACAATRAATCEVARPAVGAAACPAACAEVRATVRAAAVNLLRPARNAPGFATTAVGRKNQPVDHVSGAADRGCTGRSSRGPDGEVAGKWWSS